jgi:hypothetical protein
MSNGQSTGFTPYGPAQNFEAQRARAASISVAPSRGMGR